MVGLLAVTLVACAPATTTLVSAEDLEGDDGMWLYGQHCAGCHGEEGRGDEETPAIAGPDALPEQAAEGSTREVPFRTALDVYRYVKQQMPPLAPGSLDDETYWAVVGYSLRQAGIEVGEQPLNEKRAAEIPLR